MAWALLAGWLLVRAAIDLRAGKRAIEAARAQSTAAELVEGRPAAELRRAQRRLSNAENALTSPVLAPARVLPVAGRQVRSLAALSRTAATVADVGATAVTRARRILDRPTTGGEKAAAAGELAALADDAHDRLDGLELGPSRGLLGPIARARTDLAEKLAEVRSGLRRGAAGGRAVATLLQGPRRYLVLAANNSEMRAGAGMFLQAGELETEGGSLHLRDVRSVTELPVPPGSVPLEGDLRDRWGWLHPNDSWQNLMLSPRFDVQASLAARMWEAAGHPPVDGVLALDPVAFSGLLEGTGPVELDGLSVSADTVVTELLHNQYLRYDPEQTRQRREALGQLAREAFRALEEGRWSVAGLAGGLVPIVDGRHILAWSSRPEEQAHWKAAGMTGELGGDSLLVGLSSRSGNKLDFFQRLTGDIAVARTAQHSSVVVRLTLHNTVPLGEPPYVAADLAGTGAPEGTYLGILAVNVPGRARNVRIDGVDRLAVAGPDGPTQVVGFQLQLGRDERRDVVVRFELPGTAGGLQIEPSARVPAIEWTTGEEKWTDDAPRRVTWGQGG